MLQLQNLARPKPPSLRFGLVFLGIGLLIAGSAAWVDNDLFQEFITAIGDAPIILLAANNLLDMNAALPVIYGANVGTAGTALLAAAGANVDARRVAAAHTLFEVIAVAIFVPLTGPFADLLDRPPGRQRPHHLQRGTDAGDVAVRVAGGLAAAEADARSGRTRG